MGGWWYRPTFRERFLFSTPGGVRRTPEWVQDDGHSILSRLPPHLRITRLGIVTSESVLGSGVRDRVTVVSVGVSISRRDHYEITKLPRTTWTEGWRGKSRLHGESGRSVNGGGL